MKDEPSLQGKVANSLLWSSLASWGQGVASLLIFMALARLLGPQQLGLFAAVMVVITFIHMFAEQGLSEAIVQRPDITPGVLNAVALINFALALLILLATWYAAPFIAQRMGLPEMVPVLRVVASVILISAMTFAQQAMLRRNFNYRWLSLSTLVSTVVSGALGIGLAAAGLGVWSMVIQALTASILSNLLIWSKPQWCMGLKFDFKGVMPLVSFGSKRLLTNLLEMLSTRYIELFIAATLGAAALGLYSVGVKLYQALMQMLGGSLLNVMLNGFSRIAHDRPRLLEAYYRSVGMVMSTVSAGFILLALLAPELTLALFGERFAISAHIMEPVMVWGALQSIMWSTGTAYNAIGRPAISLGLGVMRACVLLPVLWWVRDQSLISMVYAFMAAQFATVPVSLWVARTVLGISLRRQAWVMLPFVLALLVTAAVVIGLRRIEWVVLLPVWGRLLLLGLAGVATYATVVYAIAQTHVRDMVGALRLAICTA